MALADHPTVKQYNERQTNNSELQRLDAEQLRELVLAAGADDVGFVDFKRGELDDRKI